MDCIHIDITYLDSQQDVPGMYVQINKLLHSSLDELSYSLCDSINSLSEMLKSDMKSLTEEGTGSSLNLQQRVISSGLQLHLYDALPNEAL